MMGRTAANSIPATGPKPKLVGFIPGKDLGLVDKSVRYLKSHVLLNQRFFIAHQNILNLNRKTEAVLAQYLQDKQKTQLLLIRYANLKEAVDAYQSFMKVYLPDAGGKIVSEQKTGSGPLPGSGMNLFLLFLELPRRPMPRLFSMLQKKKRLGDIEHRVLSQSPLLPGGREDRGYRKELEHHG